MFQSSRGLRRWRREMSMPELKSMNEARNKTRSPRTRGRGCARGGTRRGHHFLSDVHQGLQTRISGVLGDVPRPVAGQYLYQALARLHELIYVPSHGYCRGFARDRFGPLAQHRRLALNLGDLILRLAERTLLTPEGLKRERHRHDGSRGEHRQCEDPARIPRLFTSRN